MFYMSGDLLRYVIYVEKLLLKFKYDIIRNLNNKLKDINLFLPNQKKLMMILLKKKTKYLKENN